MNSLVVKLGAAGDVVRTTPLLKQLSGRVIWLTDSQNTVLLDGVAAHLQCFSWQQRDLVPDITYDLIINLEEVLEVGLYVRKLRHKQWFGTYADSDNVLRYTESSRRWFDLSLISSHGRQQADRLKRLNRRSYQEMIFEGLGLRFTGDPYVLPQPIDTGLSGDVAIAGEAGPMWPMKQWAHFGELKRQLERRGLTVNVLPRRSSLLEHLSDVRNHRCLVSGDTLPMHLALGTEKRCVTLFTCTSPWEIYGYGIQRKIVSPLLEEYFYKRDWDERATTAITAEEVAGAVMGQLELS
jgi:lipopolysaccharide heptosyltransferase II